MDVTTPAHCTQAILAVAQVSSPLSALLAAGSERDVGSSSTESDRDVNEQRRIRFQAVEVIPTASAASHTGPEVLQHTQPASLPDNSQLEVVLVGVLLICLVAFLLSLMNFSSEHESKTASVLN